MKLTTITLIQAVLALIIVFTNALLQTKSYFSLGKATINTDNSADLAQAKKLLFVSIVMQFIASLLLIIVTILVIVYREKFQKHMSKLINLALVIGILLMLTGGSLGAAASFKMQCYRTDDANVNTAWQQSMLTSLLGILGTMLTLLIHAFIRRGDIKEHLRTALTTKRITVPTHVPVEGTGPPSILTQKPTQLRPSILKTPSRRPPVAFKPGLGTGFQPPLTTN